MTTAADPSNYPVARKRGVAEAPDGGPLNIQAPRMRVYPFALSVATDKRSTIWTPMVTGPALIKDIRFAVAFQSDPAFGTLELGQAPSASPEASVTRDTPKPFTILTELIDPASLVDGRAGDGFPNTSMFVANAPPVFPLDLVLLPGNTYVCLSYTWLAGGTQVLYGHFRILEGVDPEALRFFL